MSEETQSAGEPDGRDPRAALETDGFTIFRQVVDRDLVAEAGAHVTWLQARHPELRPENLGHWLVHDDPFWIRLISDGRLLDLAQLFLGPDLALFASHYICKPPGSGQPVLWHQDAAYWPLEPMRVVTLWLAVDDSTPENGCVRFIPGSHHHRVVPLRKNAEVANVLGSEADTEVDESLAVDAVLAAGDVEVHDPGIMHASYANTSSRRRCGLTIRYIPTSTKILGDEPPICAFWLRGAPGVNAYQPLPSFDPARHFPFRGAEGWPANSGLPQASH